MQCATIDPNCEYCDAQSCIYCNTGYALDQNSQCKTCEALTTVQYCSSCYFDDAIPKHVCYSCPTGMSLYND